MTKLEPSLRALLGVLGLHVSALALIEPTSARADAPGPPPAWVIPGGQEALVTDMLGGTGALTGCSREDVAIRGDRIDADFRCDGSAELVRARLERRGESECTGVCTEKFSLSILSPAPAGFVEALRGRVAQHEDRFVFSRPEASRAPAGSGSPHGIVGEPVRVAEEGALRAFAIDHGPAAVSGSLLAFFVVRALVRRRVTASRG